MTNEPLRSIFISDFRRLEGHRVLPLDAPIVLIHGANGTGKTSVLSALELALTGEIRSMRRQDARYTAHLPFHGQDFAAVRAEVSAQFASGQEPVTMTVAGSRVEGPPALGLEAARFYAERCYLDQVSLGQLLELYQYREGKEESALARFVNELLGLEQLDALRSGLADSTDFRNLKKLSGPLAEAEVQARRAEEDLQRSVRDLEPARANLEKSRDALARALQTLGLALPVASTQQVGTGVASLLDSVRTDTARSSAQELNKSLTALGGRIEGLLSRPGVMRVEDARIALALASSTYDGWREEHQAAIEAWSADARRLEAPATGPGIDDEVLRMDQTLAQQDNVRTEIARLEGLLEVRREELQEVQAKLADAQEHAGSLVEGLAALREQSADNVCPVCDRDFNEVSPVHLTAHIDARISELTDRGRRIRELRTTRDELLAATQADQQLLERLQDSVWPLTQRGHVKNRRADLADLRERLQQLQPVILTGQELAAQVRRAQAELDDLEANTRETIVVRSEIEDVARALDAPPPRPAESLKDAWGRLADVSAERLAEADARHEAHAVARESLTGTLQFSERVAQLQDSVAEAAERKGLWESRVREAKRRQAVAKAVHDASSKARASIVQRVFTESLNDLWRSVFTRLAPREPYVPAFGIPMSSRTALELTLQTIHRSGDSGGSPQMMLSAGNLNTAALSLFIALHLAVEPVVPCLVFDDPVQAMDEVHIAQFAGLIRVLAKHHNRQVIIAVHERELFEYLSLELSPAFQGDQLLTIELVPGSEMEDPKVTRLTWSPDVAIAF